MEEIHSTYSTWFNRMTEYGFTEGQDFIQKMEESTDYQRVTQNCPTPGGVQENTERYNN